MDEEENIIEEPKNVFLEDDTLQLNDLYETTTTISLYLFYQVIIMSLQVIFLAYYLQYEWKFQRIVTGVAIATLTGLYGFAKTYHGTQEYFAELYDYIDWYFLITGVCFIFVFLEIPISSYIFLICFQVMVRKYNNLPYKWALLHLFSIFLKIDGWINIPWIILLFEGPLLNVAAASLMVELWRQKQQTKIKSRALQIHIIKDMLLTFQTFIFSVILVNWETFDFPFSIVVSVALLFNAVIVAFFVIFKKEISYAMIIHEWKTVARLSQNIFSKQSSRGLDPNTQFSVQLCNKCCQVKANILFLPCKHLTLCFSCASKCIICPYCGVSSPQRVQIDLDSNWDRLNQQFKLNFFQNNEFKVTYER